MAFRGRGRGGFGGGGGFGYAKQEPFVLFPDIELPNIKSVTIEKSLVLADNKLQNFWKDSAYYLEETVPKKSQSTDIERYSARKKWKTPVTRDSLSQILEVKRFPRELIGGWKGQQPSRKKVRWNPESDQPLQSPSWSSQLVEDCCPERRQPLSVNMAPMGFPRVAVFYLLTAPWRASLFPWLCSLVALIDFAPSKILGLEKLDYLEKLEERIQGQEDKGEKEKKEGENEDEDEEEGEDVEGESSEDDYYKNVDFDDDDDDFNEVDDGGADEETY
uniref:DNA-directed RNA polymerase III subunit n=1 Tax=Fagus sylvatica TaxID=28930 RepID=A0A2N9GIK2_FAGSY